MVDSPWAKDQRKTLGKRRLPGRLIPYPSKSGIIDRRNFNAKKTRKRIE